MEISKYLYKKLVLFIIFLLGLTPLLWFKKGLLIAGGDQSILINPLGTFYDYRHIWNAKLSAGQPGNFSMAHLFPFQAFWFFFQNLGFSLISVEKIWFVFTFVLSGFSMYYLVSTVNHDQRNQVFKFISSVFYMFNLVVCYLIFSPFFLTLLAYSITPLILGLFIRGLDENSNSTRYAVFIGILFLLTSSIMANPPVVAVIWFVLFSYFVYYITTRGKKYLSRGVKFTFKVLIIYLLSNFWSLFVLSFSIFSDPELKVSVIGHEMSTVQAWSKISDLAQIFRLLGFQEWSLVLRGQESFPYAGYFSNAFLIITTFSLTLLAFSALLLRIKNRHLPFFVSLSLAGIFLANGVNKPLGFVYQFFYEHIPGFWIFRTPFPKFAQVIALSYAVLIGFVTSEFYFFLKTTTGKKSRNITLHKSIPGSFLVIVICLLVLSSYPLLTPNAIFSGGSGMPSLHVDVPIYWREAGKWLDKLDNRDGKLFLTPRDTMYSMYYEWKSGYGGSEIAYHLLNRPMISLAPGGSRPAQYSSDLIRLVYVLLEENLSSNLAKVLRLLNVQFVFQRNDYDYLARNTTDPQKMKYLLTNQKDIDLAFSVGKLDFYQIKNFLPHIYASSDKAGLED